MEQWCGDRHQMMMIPSNSVDGGASGIDLWWPPFLLRGAPGFLFMMDGFIRKSLVTETSLNVFL
jgi:hypothetical protein